MSAAAIPPPPRAAGPAITIVVTNYDYEAYVGRAIASALAQTYAPVDVVVVDDGSRDGSLEVIRGYPVTLVAKDNGGQTSAGIAAVPHIGGDLVIFLDADDTLYPDACARFAAAYAPDISLIVGGLDKVDTGGRIVGAYPDRPLLASGHRAHVLKHGFIPACPSSGNAFAAAHVRRMFEIAARDPRRLGRNGIDGYLLMSAPFFGRVVGIPGPLGSYLVHGANQSSSGGASPRSVAQDLRSGYWQCCGIANALEAETGERRDPIRFMDAYLLRQLIVLRLSHGIVETAPEHSTASLAAAAARKFLTYPGIGIGQRAKNIATLGAMLLGARGLGRRIVPPAAEAA